MRLMGGWKASGREGTRELKEHADATEGHLEEHLPNLRAGTEQKMLNTDKNIPGYVSDVHYVTARFS